MAIPGITYRLEQGTSLTHTQMDNNFRSVIYSSSIEDSGDTLHLHFDTVEGTDYHSIPLNGGTGGLSITGNVDNRVVTATGTAGQIQGESNFTFDGTILTITGRVSQDDGAKNIFIGIESGDSISGALESIGIGYRSSKNITGINNTALGVNSLVTATASSRTVSIGHDSLSTVSSGNFNVALGANAGGNLSTGASNVYLGNAAGPASSTSESNKLYINNAASDTPLILGDFSLGQVTFNSQVSASAFSGSYYGDGSNLTGVTATSEWDGTLDGNAQISGSLIVSGASINITLLTQPLFQVQYFQGRS